MVAEEIASPVGIPSPVAVRLGIMAFAAAGRPAVFPAGAEPFPALLRGGADRGAVAGKGKAVRRDQSLRYRLVKELSVIQMENKPERVFRF